jgi:hypothetical protein
VTELDDFAVTEMMFRHGGGFVRRLADLFRSADGDNQQRLKAAFPEYWAKYKAMAEQERQHP